MTKKEFLLALKAKGATKEQAARVLKLKTAKGLKFSDESGPSPTIKAKAQELKQGRTQANKAAKQESFKDQPAISRFGSGVKKAIYSSIPTAPPAFMQYGGQRTPQDVQSEYETTKGAKEQSLQDYEQMSEGDFAAGLGEFGGEMAMFAAPGGKFAKLGKIPGIGAKVLPYVKGAIAGLGSAGLHQQQNIESGKGINPWEVGIETGLSTVLPGIGEKVAPFLKGMGSKIIQTATKLGTKIKGQKVMNPKQVENYFDNYASWKNIIGSEKKLSAYRTKLLSEFDDLMNNLAKGKEVDIKSATIKARNELLKKSANGKVDVLDIPKINKTIDMFENMTNPLLNKSGKIDFKTAQNFKLTSLKKRSKWDKPNVLGEVDRTAEPIAKAARGTSRELTKEMEKVVPEIAPLNKRFSEMSDVKPFIEQASERFQANRFLSPQDYATLTLGGIGAGYSSYGDREMTTGKAAALAIPFLLSRGQKSPMMAKLLWELGKGAGSQSGQQLGGLGMQSARTLSNQYFGGR